VASKVREKLRLESLAQIASLARYYKPGSIPSYLIDLIGFNIPIARTLLSRSVGGLVTYRLANGIKILARPFTHDRVIIDEIFIKRSYTPLNMSVMEIEPGDIVVDLGAHIGCFSLFAASKGAHKVFAYEPLPQNFKLLLANIKINKFLDRIRAYQKAVAEERGYIEIFFDNMLIGSRSSIVASNKILSEAVTLEDIILENNINKINFLKVDIEGGELSLFKSLDKDTFDFIDKIAMESHSPSNTAILSKILREKGFIVRIRKGGSPSLFYIYAYRRNKDPW